MQSATRLGSVVALHSILPAWAASSRGLANGGIQNHRGASLDLHIERRDVRINGKTGKAILVNGQLPAPLLRWQEGEELVIRVTNHLQETTSIHWHGLILPFYMDGVPGISYPGIKPGETFTYKFPLLQSGTYWYHSHSGFQEQLGHYGPIIIEPRDGEHISCDREFIILLSDWTFESPRRVFSKLKKRSDTYNLQQRLVGDFFEDVKNAGFRNAIDMRTMWASMRMNPTDIADVTSTTYTYLLNGHSPVEGWKGLYREGEKIRLRFINASAMSIFNVRIPGLPMTVIQSDGQNIQPVQTDEFQIGTAETFDLLVEPKQGKAYTIMCESNDRSGYACGTLASDAAHSARIPELRKRPLLSMKDMAMQHDMEGHQHHGMRERISSKQVHEHASGVGVISLAENPVNRLAERPLGLENVAHRVLVYADLKSLERNPDTREHEREIELHLTSNMERYMWSFDGIKYSEVDGPILFHEGERLRLTLVNDTMMPHPIHLHGMFFEVVTGDHAYKPRKHTITVKPGEKLSLDISADAVGDWAFHCHLLYHMMAGMMRIVSVLPADEKTS